MNIWIDISNTPHVNFFKQFINEWKEKHTVLVTARPLSNTLQLLEKHGIEYHCVGEHYGKGNFAKLYGFFKRSNELHAFLKHRNVNVAISQSSFYSPYVAKKLNVPCVYTNDNEFAKGNYVAFLLAKYILLPEALRGWARGRFFEKRVVFYPGIKEGIYTKKSRGKLDDKDKNIYFRPEPWCAQYHDYFADTFDKMLVGLSTENHVIVLPRDQMQASHFSKLAEKKKNIKLPTNVETMEEISKKCAVFLGAGGSMTREFAFLGIPTVSMYQGELLAVDNYLIERGLLIHQKDPSKIDREFINALKIKKDRLNLFYQDLYSRGEQSREIINKLIDQIYSIIVPVK